MPSIHPELLLILKQYFYCYIKLGYDCTIFGQSNTEDTSVWSLNLPEDLWMRVSKIYMNQLHSQQHIKSLWWENPAQHSTLDLSAKTYTKCETSKFSKLQESPHH